MSFQISTCSVINGTITIMERTPPDEPSLVRLAQERVREQLPERWSVRPVGDHRALWLAAALVGMALVRAGSADPARR